MLPSLSEALAESATTLPVVNVCPFAGLVRLTVGGALVAAVIVMTWDLVPVTPASFVAVALMV